MGKALVIKHMNFSTNKLATVQLIEEIPCTGVSLDYQTLSINYGETGTLTATAIPADTTDEITWNSSDTNVATIADGVVTATGLGTATITVSCGSYSATCTVTVVAVMSGTNLPQVNLSGVATYSGGDGMGYIETGARGGTMLSSSGNKEIDNHIDYSTPYYPYPIPENAKRIKITKTSNSFNVLAIHFYSLTASSHSYGRCAQLVDKITGISFTNNVYIGEIPQHDGYPTIDGIAIWLYGASGGYSFSDSDFNNITIEFLPEE